MKRLFVILAVLVASAVGTTYAEVVRDGNNFKVEVSTKEKDTKTTYTWETKDGTKYPIFITKKGACYIKRISKKGKEYKYYLPKEIQTQIKNELNKK
jgi:hypothetical protein